jgi:hypothetical protein
MDTAKRLLEDPTIAPREVASKRMDICKNCEYFRDKSQICDHCGCYLPLKTTFANVKCPIDKWEEYNEN